MSASVFKPIRSLNLNFEMPRIRGSLVLNRGMRGMEKVRRVLFEPVDHAETEQFLQRELAQQTLSESNKWEFDFKQERPYHPNNNKGRYVWKPITPTKITLAPRKRLQRDECECDNSELYPEMPEKIPAACADEATTAPVAKRQSKITDFMQSRKRPMDIAFAKMAATSSSIPTKRASHTNSNS